MQLSPIVVQRGLPVPCGLFRGLAAILSADIAGYTRLMARDEEGTHARERHLRHDVINPAVAGHHGRIVKNTGDGFLAVFNSAFDAVRCAMAMQQQIELENAALPREQAIQFRMGINIGDIIVEPEDVFGDGVNVAARLQSVAEPGGIFVSASVYTQIKGKLDCVWISLGNKRLKNIADPVHVYKTLPGAVAAASFRWPWPFALPTTSKVCALLFAAGVGVGALLKAFLLDVPTAAANVPQSLAQPRELSGAADPRSDGKEAAGLLVQELLKVIETPELANEETLKRLQMSVSRATKDQQALRVAWSASRNVDLKTQREPESGLSTDESRWTASSARLCASTALDEAVKLDPKDANALFRRGQLRVVAGEYHCAIEDFGQLLRVNPSNVNALNNRCWTRAIVGQLSEALADCDEALRLRPHFSGALDSRALTRLKLGQLDQAVSDYGAALSQNPQQAESWYGRGIARLKLKDASGHADLEKARAINPRIAEEFERYGVPLLDRVFADRR